ncbi:hypothetical protein PI86_13810 [Burkholderia sp. A9]|nr:hypothetical protein PI86_13810 [Burkholderia sp. A9]
MIAASNVEYVRALNEHMRRHPLRRQWMTLRRDDDEIRAFGPTGVAKAWADTDAHLQTIYSMPSAPVLTSIDLQELEAGSGFDWSTH